MMVTKNRLEITSMFCTGCGNQFLQGSSFCPSCGRQLGQQTNTHKRTYKPSRKKTLVIIIGAVIAIGILGSLTGKSHEASRLNQGVASESGSVPPVASQGSSILDDTKRTARANYIDGLRDSFRNSGVDATVSDSEGTLIVISDSLKTKPDRDSLMTRVFDTKTRHALCVMGFRNVNLTVGGLLGDGDLYTLGCPESKEQQQARIASQRQNEDSVVAQLQGSDPKMKVSRDGDDLVLQIEDSQALTPRMIRAIWFSKFTNRQMQEWCNDGFKGARVNGTRIPFPCRS